MDEREAVERLKQGDLVGMEHLVLNTRRRQRAQRT